MLDAGMVHRIPAISLCNAPRRRGNHERSQADGINQQAL
jgi:hypothetical protein